MEWGEAPKLLSGMEMLQQLDGVLTEYKKEDLKKRRTELFDHDKHQYLNKNYDVEACADCPLLGKKVEELHHTSSESISEDIIILVAGPNQWKMRIYGPDPEVLNALRGTNTETLVDVPNENIRFIANDASTTANWVQNNIKNYSPAGLQNQIKVSTSIAAGLLSISYPPSQGSFSNEAKPFIKPIINLLVQNNAPLLVNAYPYLSYIGNRANIGLDYALFTSPGIVVQDGSFGYQNIFDAIVDAHYSALEKEGGSNIRIVVSETGWPSEGNPGVATFEYAGTYSRNVVSLVKSGRGTPRRPGTGIETYLFAMFDENNKPGEETERHFGLFFPNQQCKYGISFN
ncbi:hypothetical protein ACH5RR_003209 [Cinchona calisaya]|uniref:Glucan endo-1,3-beta-D-glucosidase n=1 Tax=Cinchona calisaya TaxID=153742 RepID=A0ABD3AUA9_9GENT